MNKVFKTKLKRILFQIPKAFEGDTETEQCIHNVVIPADPSVTDWKFPKVWTLLYKKMQNFNRKSVPVKQHYCSERPVFELIHLLWVFRRRRKIEQVFGKNRRHFNNIFDKEILLWYLVVDTSHKTIKVIKRDQNKAPFGSKYNRTIETGFWRYFFYFKMH